MMDSSSDDEPLECRWASAGAGAGAGAGAVAAVTSTGTGARAAAGASRGRTLKRDPMRAAKRRRTERAAFARRFRKELHDELNEVRKNALLDQIADAEEKLERARAQHDKIDKDQERHIQELSASVAASKAAELASQTELATAQENSKHLRETHATEIRNRGAQERKLRAENDALTVKLSDVTSAREAERAARAAEMSKLSALVDEQKTARTAELAKLADTLTENDRLAAELAIVASEREMEHAAHAAEMSKLAASLEQATARTAEVEEMQRKMQKEHQKLVKRIKGLEAAAAPRWSTRLRSGDCGQASK